MFRQGFDERFDLSSEGIDIFRQNLGVFMGITKIIQRAVRI